MHNKSYPITIIAIISVIAGIIIGMQLKMTKDDELNYALQIASDISSQLKSVTSENERLKSEVLELKSNSIEHERLLIKDGQPTYSTINELSKMQIIAGFLEVQGQGVVVTLSDSNKTDTSTDQTLYLVHDEDILVTVNELYSAGAEAISINGVRLITTSGIRCVGPVVSINGVKLTAPYVIKAIGDSQVLEGALRLHGGIVDSLTPWGVGITIEQLDELIVEKYEQQINFQYAMPTKRDNG